MNKKLLAVLMLVVLCVMCIAGFAACNGDNNDEIDKPDAGDNNNNNQDDKPSVGEDNKDDKPNTDKPDGGEKDKFALAFSEDGLTAKYGLYPQTHIADEALIAELDKLSPSEINGWYLHEESYYVKQQAKVYNNESYVFDDGTPIVNGTEYWFKCEPITWRVLGKADGECFLLSDKLLTAHSFYADYNNRNADGGIVYANNYAQSDVRAWLNGEFYNTAFALGGRSVKATSVDNAAVTTDDEQNRYACTNTQDKVYLPSCKDYLNSSYGFDTNAAETSATRECKTTDYARAMGAWCNRDKGYNGSYWTRSPSSEFYYCAWNVNSAGLLSAYAVDGNSHCVRPCITVSL